MGKFDCDARIQGLLAEFEGDPLVHGAFAEQRIEAAEAGDTERLAELDSLGVVGYALADRAARGEREIIAAVAEVGRDGFEVLAEEGHQWLETVAQLVDAHGEHAVNAMGLFVEQRNGEHEVTALELEEIAEDAYQGVFDSVAAWARSEYEGRDRMGILTGLADFVDWRSAGEWYYLSREDVLIFEVGGRAYVFEQEAGDPSEQ
ncbi:hypothetical protein [Kitasatospora viridis]|uniref:Antirestriction protein ArdA n=1 Tax=Kitasatospora viridis TaxID=281105 RepID=A0A561SA21_9ACTN|nr:hypothetical protein [Kitasatospora viridis]TWF71720.1 hypothetical protein FHX73_1891 [Kitasatospora viridis]